MTGLRRRGWVCEVVEVKVEGQEEEEEDGEMQV